MANGIVALADQGLLPSNYGTCGIFDYQGVHAAVIAITNGITTSQMSKLSELGIKVADYSGYGIVNWETAEAVINSGINNVNYLGNTGNPALSTRVAEMRQELVEKYNPVTITGNIAVARNSIPGIASELKAYSALSFTPDGYVPTLENRTFVTMSINSKGKVNGSRAWDRFVDTEARLLESIAATLGNDVTVRGTIDLHTFYEPCESCISVIRQFALKYKNIIINISWDYP
jgi:filamentous hemagglutinin